MGFGLPAEGRGDRDDRGTCVAEVMQTSVYTVTTDTLAAAAERLAAQNDIHHLLVLDEGNLGGIVCENDLRQANRTGLVSSCMKTPVYCIGPRTTIKQAADLMQENRVGALPIVVDGMLVGMVTRGDLRQAGLVSEDLGGPVCSACKGEHHVRVDPHAGGVAFCFECLGPVETRALTD